MLPKSGILMSPQVKVQFSSLNGFWQHHDKITKGINFLEYHQGIHTVRKSAESLQICEIFSSNKSKMELLGGWYNKLKDTIKIYLN